jgi:hypothetical protein
MTYCQLVIEYFVASLKSMFPLQIFFNYESNNSAGPCLRIMQSNKE